MSLKLRGVRIHSYCLDDRIVERHHGEMEWVTRIQQAFEGSRFMLYYQPIRALNGEEYIPPLWVIIAYEKRG